MRLITIKKLVQPNIILFSGGINLEKAIKPFRLLAYAGKRKILLYLSWILSAISAAMAFCFFALYLSFRRGGACSSRCT